MLLYEPRPKVQNGPIRPKRANLGGLFPIPVAARWRPAVTSFRHYLARPAPIKGMKKDQQTKIFFFGEHPLMILGIEALIKEESDLKLCGHCENHEDLSEQIEGVQPDVLLLDLSLYTRESLDFLREIRTRFPDLIIILLSVHTAAEYVAKAQEAGANGYVLKIEKPERIVEAVRATLAGENYVSSLVRKPGEEHPHSIDSPINLLSKQEFEILQLIGKGRTNRQIAEETNSSVKSIEEQISAIQEKLDLSSPLELLQFAFHWVHHEGGFS